MFFALRRSCHTTSFFAEILRVKNGREVAPYRFLFHRKSVSRHLLFWGRATHLPFSPKICELAPLCSVVTPHDFLFRSPPTWLGASSIASKGIPCAFSSSKGNSCEQKREPTCELLRPRNASTPNPSCTAPAPPSPSLMRCSLPPMWMMIRSVLFPRDHDT